MGKEVDENTLPLWKQELRWKNLGYQHKNPCTFVEPQCGQPSLLFLIWRGLAAVTFTIILIYGMATYEFGTKWLIFLSNWTFLLLIINTWMQLIISSYHYHKYSRKRKSEATPYKGMPLVYRISWILSTVQLVLAPLVALGYWLVIFDQKWDVGIFNITSHGINAAYVLIDMWFSGAPIRLLHFYVPILYGALYAIFTYIYYKAGGTGEDGNRALYYYLDYEKYPGYAGVIIIAMVLVGTITHLIIFAIFRFKRSLHKRYCCSIFRGHHDQFPDPPESEYSSVDDNAKDRNTPPIGETTVTGGGVNMGGTYSGSGYVGGVVNGAMTSNSVPMGGVRINQPITGGVYQQSNMTGTISQPITLGAANFQQLNIRLTPSSTQPSNILRGPVNQSITLKGTPSIYVPQNGGQIGGTGAMGSMGTSQGVTGSIGVASVVNASNVPVASVSQGGQYFAPVGGTVPFIIPQSAVNGPLPQQTNGQQGAMNIDKQGNSQRNAYFPSSSQVYLPMPASTAMTSVDT